MVEALWLHPTDERWSSLLENAAGYDFYHLPSYHALAEITGEGEARLFVYREGDRFISLPLLIREIASTNGLRDATSIYGYSGPIVSAALPSPDLVERFRQHLTSAIAEQQIIAVFSRMHPLLDQVHLIQGLGEICKHGTTVSIDLQIPLEHQVKQYNKNHRRNIKRLNDNGYVCCIDEYFYHLTNFIDTYYENMTRVRANPYYLFPRSYFEMMVEKMGDWLWLIVCKRGEEFTSGALFTVTKGIVQYHLGAVGMAHLHMSPLKLVIDTARRISAARGAKILHLGGGHGGAEDSLFRFKAGFSERRHPFLTWRWVTRPAEYKRLVALRGGSVLADFFPAYRA